MPKSRYGRKPEELCNWDECKLTSLTLVWWCICLQQAKKQNTDMKTKHQETIDIYTAKTTPWVTSYRPETLNPKPEAFQKLSPQDFTKKYLVGFRGLGV